jgi:hypothetical protein
VSLTIFAALEVSMKPKILAGGAVVLAGLVFSGPLSAHHAARMFEITTPIRVKGTVVRYTWANPHSAIIVEQKTEDGKTIRWALESSVPIGEFETRGFNKDSFKKGDVIEACGVRGLTVELLTSAGILSGPRPVAGPDCHRVR